MESKGRSCLMGDRARMRLVTISIIETNGDSEQSSNYILHSSFNLHFPISIAHRAHASLWVISLSDEHTLSKNPSRSQMVRVLTSRLCPSSSTPLVPASLCQRDIDRYRTTNTCYLEDHHGVCVCVCFIARSLSRQAQQQLAFKAFRSALNRLIRSIQHFDHRTGLRVLIHAFTRHN